MSLQFLLTWLTTPIHWITWNLIKAINLHWSFKSPPLGMALKLIEDIDIPKNAKLCMLNFSAIMEIKNQTSYFANMEIFKNSKNENRLLKASSLRWFPHEVCQIRIINSRNENICSRIFHGGRKSIGKFNDIKKEVKKLIYNTTKRGLSIQEIEISHTHPSLEVMIEYRNESKFIFNGLSNSDCKLGLRLAPFIQYPLRIKAITLVVNYSKIFF